MFSKIMSWAKAPTYPNDHEKTRSSTLLNIILWMFIAASSFYGLLAPIEPEFRIRRTVIILPFVIILFVLKQVLNKGYLRFVGILIVFATWVIFTAAMLFGADYKNPAYMGYIIVVVTAGLVLNWRAAIIWGMLSIATNAIVITLGQQGVLPLSGQETPPFAFWAAQTVYIIVTTVLLSQAIRKIDEAFEKAQHEINERKRVEAERETFIKELEAKNAELERFTYTVSHDLKSPLITINGYLGFLEKDAQAGDLDKLNHDVKRINEAVEKMQGLLSDLLELSRIGRLINLPEEVDFAAIAQEAMRLTEIQLQEKNIKVSIQENMPKVYVDKKRIVEVMQNLLENAAKFIGNPSTPQVEIGVKTDNDKNIFFVKDNGIGIAPQYHERIFGLFDKLSADTEGSGIGLALVKRIIETHGGNIWVESDLGKGATFYFTLPQKET
jgi:signal transduction histidine kinase